MMNTRKNTFITHLINIGGLWSPITKPFVSLDVPQKGILRPSKEKLKLAQSVTEKRQQLIAVGSGESESLMQTIKSLFGGVDK